MVDVPFYGSLAEGKTYSFAPKKWSRRRSFALAIAASLCLWAGLYAALAAFVF